MYMYVKGYFLVKMGKKLAFMKKKVKINCLVVVVRYIRNKVNIMDKLR